MAKRYSETKLDALDDDKTFITRRGTGACSRLMIEREYIIRLPEWPDISRIGADFVSSASL
jgi:hypothetical protein